VSVIDLLPERSEVTDILPGRWHVRLPEGGALFSATQESEWLLLRAKLPRGRLLAMSELEDTYAGIKIAESDNGSVGYAELRAEIPSTASKPDRVWAESTLAEFIAALAVVVSATGTTPAETGDRMSALTDAAIDSLLAAGADLGFEVVHAERPAFAVRVPVGGIDRTVTLEPHGHWFRLWLPVGTGDLLNPVEPLLSALQLHMRRISGALGIARASSRSFDDQEGLLLGFNADVPAPVTSWSLQHALGALTTAAEQFEEEIETLATEAILAHAYLVITGPHGGAGTQPIEP